jgi:hypothetical protein
VRKNILHHIRECKRLLDPIVSDQLLDVQFEEFVPIIDITRTHDCMCTDFSTEIISRFEEYQEGKVSGYVCTNIRSNREVSIFYNPDGGVRVGEIWSIFDLDTISGEEDLFMLSTVQETFDLTMEDIEVFNKIWSLYYE